MSIAAEAHPRGEDDVFAAAYDAALARDPEERAEFIETLEELFREADEAERRQSRVYRMECRTGQEFDL